MGKRLKEVGKRIVKGMRPEGDPALLGWPPYIRPEPGESAEDYNARVGRVAEERREKAKQLGLDPNRRCIRILVIRDWTGSWESD